LKLFEPSRCHNRIAVEQHDIGGSGLRDRAIDTRDVAAVGRISQQEQGRTVSSRALSKTLGGREIGAGVVDNNQPPVAPGGVLEDAGEASLELSRRAVNGNDNIPPQAGSGWNRDGAPPSQHIIGADRISSYQMAPTELADVEIGWCRASLW